MPPAPVAAVKNTNTAAEGEMTICDNLITWQWRNWRTANSGHSDRSLVNNLKGKVKRIKWVGEYARKKV